jgi:hypothetical protein
MMEVQALFHNCALLGVIALTVAKEFLMRSFFVKKHVYFRWMAGAMMVA